MTINYFMTKDTLTFYKEGEIRYIQKDQNFLYDLVKENLSTGSLDLDLCPKSLLSKAIKEKSNLYGIAERVTQLEKDNLPTAPLLSFVQKVPEHVLLAYPEIVSKVGTINVPLTWEGDLILYQRAAWIRGTTEEHWTNSDTFLPYTTIQTDSYQTAGSFSWTMDKCPDTGNAYEVIVNPEHIISVENNVWRLKEVTQLAMLGERPVLEQRAETGIVEYLTQCSELGHKLAIRLPFNAGTAAKLVQSMFEEHVTAESLNNIVPIRQTVRGGC